MRRSLLPVAAALAAAAATAGLATAGERARTSAAPSAPYAIGLWGDLPYSELQRTVGVPNLIEDMNNQKLSFSVHTGDIKSGGSRCDDPVYAQFEGLLDSFDSASMYTPGDNEWTDCDRPSAGAYDSEERLDHIRTTLFDDLGSFGEKPIPLEQQAAPYIENRRWYVGRVAYATIHVVGSDDNLGDVAPDPAEHAAREKANLAWLKSTFANARKFGSKAVMITIQANPGFDQSDPTRAPLRDPRTLAPQDGFRNFLEALRAETIAFRRPVSLVHGDSHYFRIDKPLLDAEGRRLENFTRVEVPGDNAQTGNNDVQWVKVAVDSRSREVFSFQPQVVPGNRTAVPSP